MKTSEQINEIAKDLCTAEEFNVTTMTAYRAVNKQSWSHI